uniref:Uncharacterized protein n=1 Tax=Sipha flava TaxID=143950 RepID=A0A2S2QUH5_9HEMI
MIVIILLYIYNCDIHEINSNFTYNIKNAISNFYFNTNREIKITFSFFSVKILRCEKIMYTNINSWRWFSAYFLNNLKNHLLKLDRRRMEIQFISKRNPFN